jgi:hypothetical protein
MAKNITLAEAQKNPIFNSFIAFIKYSNKVINELKQNNKLKKIETISKLTAYNKILIEAENKLDLEFKEKQKREKFYVPISISKDRKFNIDTVTLNEFNINHDKESETAVVHLGMFANEYARSFNAMAFTIGNEIFFRNGSYKPETEEGRKLLAHELTHVSQNKNKPLADNRTRNELEKEAILAEQKEEYKEDPYIIYDTGIKKYKIKKSVAKKIDYLSDKYLDEWVEKQEGVIPAEQYINLLYKYKDYLESKK